MPPLPTTSELPELLPYLSAPERAELDHLLAKEATPPPLEAFTRATFPAYQVNWHHRVLCEYLDRFVSGEIKRLMVFMPPRHGKSELVSRRLPAYILGRNPDAGIIACSYSADLSSRMNRDVQRIIDTPEYAALFPATRLGASNIRTVSGSFLRNSDIFEVVGRRGYYRSAGVGGGITGMGFTHGIIDDPIKNRKEADSYTYRQAVWEWYTSTFYTRREKDAGILLTVTRWNADDLAGRLLAQAAADPNAEQWQVVNFPAICEAPGTNPDDPRAEGEALWPDKYDLATLEKTRLAIGGYDWTALYQQSPRAREGNIFKVENIQTVDVAPAQLRGTVRRWDLAATAKTTADYTAGAKVARGADGLWYVLGMKRGRWTPAAVEATVRQTAELDGRATRVLIEQEPGASGKSVVAGYVRLLAGFDVRADHIRGDKVLRAQPFAAQVEASNVRLLRGSWNADFLDELAAFPNGAHDDQVDAVCGAFNDLAGNAPGQGFSASYL